MSSPNLAVRMEHRATDLFSGPPRPTMRANSTIILAAIAAVLSCNAHATSSKSESKTVQVTVAYGDLNLDNLTDARVFFARLEKAAKRACGPKPFMQSRYDVIPEGLKQTYKECRTRAVGDAVARLDAPLVSRAYAESRQSKPDDVARR